MSTLCLQSHCINYRMIMFLRFISCLHFVLFIFFSSNAILILSLIILFLVYKSQRKSRNAAAENFNVQENEIFYLGHIVIHMWVGHFVSSSCIIPDITSLLQDINDINQWWSNHIVKYCTWDRFTNTAEEYMLYKLICRC